MKKQTSNDERHMLLPSQWYTACVLSTSCRVVPTYDDHVLLVPTEESKESACRPREEGDHSRPDEGTRHHTAELEMIELTRGRKRTHEGRMKEAR